MPPIYDHWNEIALNDGLVWYENSISAAPSYAIYIIIYQKSKEKHIRIMVQ